MLVRLGMCMRIDQSQSNPLLKVLTITVSFNAWDGRYLRTILMDVRPRINSDRLTDSAESWYLRIELAGKVAKTRRIVLHYKNARAPRIRAAGDDKLKVEAFSDPDISRLLPADIGETAGIPQHPVAEHKAITVTYAARRLWCGHVRL